MQQLHLEFLVHKISVFTFKKCDFFFAFMIPHLRSNISFSIKWARVKWQFSMYLRIPLQVASNFFGNVHISNKHESWLLAFHLWMVPKMGLPSSRWEKEEKGARCTTTWDMTIGPMIMTKTLDFWCASPFLFPFRPKIFQKFISWWKSWFSFRILTCFQLGKALDLLLEISALTAQSLFLFAKKSLKSEKC